MTKGPFASADTLKDYLDMSIHTIRQWVREGKIPRTAYIKVGNTYRYHIKAVQDALMNYDARRSLTPAEREQIASNIIEDLTGVSSDKPTHIPEKKVEHAEDNLQRQVDGLQPLREPVEIEPEVEELLNDYDDDLEDL